jgi:hypothetical protein
MEKDLSENILHKIKEEKIKPKSRWQFVLQGYAVWLIFFVSIISGAVSLAVSLYLLRINDWGSYVFIDSNFINFVLITLPYFWLIIFPVFLWISYRYLQHTKAGYRLEFLRIVAFNLGASVLLGVSFYAVGIGRFTDNIFIKKAPFYGEMMMEREKMWHNPETGVLAGKIGEVEEGETFELSSIVGEEWVVEYSEARVAGGVVVERGIMVRVFGDRLSGTGFVAREIKPLSGPGREFRRFIPELASQIIREVK